MSEIDQAALLERMAALDVADQDIIIFRLADDAPSAMADYARLMAVEVYALRGVPVIVVPESMVVGALPLRPTREPRWRSASTSTST